MDGRKIRNGKFEEGLIMDHHSHRIPHIQSGANLISKNKSVIVDTVAYSTRRPALVVKGGVKKYGSTLVLHNLNMFAKEGTIYCLVGASNTGKSTILDCITGQKRLTKGELKVFGSVPSSASSGIPGRRVGYMPQELGLHTDLSITEVLQYHGRMVGMNLQQIAERTDKVTELLDLQHLKIPLSNLSPGLQKRASLACALLHEPELIVLDHPTNGMDILFQKGTSVILTTQNLEEARQAHRVGVLQNGRLLVEDSPTSLLHRHGTQLLAEAVAKLSIKDTIRLKKEGEKKNGKDEVVCMDEWNSSFGIPSGLEDYKNATGIISSVSYKDWVEQVNHGDEDQIKLGLAGKDSKSCKNANRKKIDDGLQLPAYPNPSKIGNRFRALSIKQFLLWKHNPGTFLVSLILPLLVIAGFCHCIGRAGQLNNVNIGVVNMDSEDKNFTWNDCRFVAGCSNKMLPCRFLDTLAAKDDFKFVDFNTEAEAMEEMKNGKIFALIQFDNGFGSDLFSRVTQKEYGENLKSTSPQFLYGEYVNIFMKKFLSEKMLHAVLTLEQALAADCNKDLDENLSVSNIEDASTITPLALLAESEPTTSSNDTDNVSSSSRTPGYPEFYIPAAMILVSFFAPLFTSGCLFFQREREQGLLKRASVSGAYTWESLLIHIFAQIPSLLGTTAILILVPLFLFEIEIQMYLIWEVVLLLCLSGFLGMSLSFLLCTIFDKFHPVSLIATICLVTSLFLSGLIWPIESQYWVLGWVSHYLPLTLPPVSLRSIIVRNWDLLILETGVWQGFAVLLAWIGFIWLILILVLVTRHLKR